MTKRKTVTTRRSVIKGGSAAVVSALAFSSYARKAYAATPMKISSYGGYFEDTLSEAVYPLFTKETGIPIESVSQQGSNAWWTVIRTGIQAGTPPVDVSMSDGQATLRFTDLMQPLDESKIPNLPNVTKSLVSRTGDGRLLAVAVLAWYTTFVTNTEEISAPPASWADAWNPEYKDKLGWSKNIELNYLLDITAATFFGGSDILNTKDGIMKVMLKAAELRENVTLWWQDEGQFQQALQTGEVPAGQYYHDVTNLAAADGFPVTSTFPKEGGVIDFGSWVLIKGSEKRAEAHEFINWCCDPAVQAEISRKVGTAPTVDRSLTDLTDEEFAFVSSPLPPIVPNYTIYVDHGDWMAEEWNKLLSGL